MDFSLLDGLHDRLIACEGNSILFDDKLTQSPQLASHLGGCMGFAFGYLNLDAPSIVSSVDPSGWLTVSGSITALGNSERSVLITFFLSCWQDNVSLECVVAYGSLPSGWLATNAFEMLPKYVTYRSGTPQWSSSFFGQIPFNGAATYSSFDFVLLQEFKSQIVVTAPGSLGDLSKFGAGLNLIGQVQTTGEIWHDVKSLLEVPSEINIAGLVWRPGDDPSLSIRYSYYGNAAVNFPSIDGLEADLSQITFSSGLDPSGRDPSLCLLLQLSAADVTIDFEVVLNIGSGTGVIKAALDSPITISSSWLEVFGVSGILSLLEKDLLGGSGTVEEAFGSLALTNASATFAVSPASFTGLSITVEPDFPWPLIEGHVAVLPCFTYSLARDELDVSSQYVDVVADWFLSSDADGAGCVVQVGARTDTAQVIASLKVGESLDVGAFIGEFFPNAPAVVREIDLVDIEFEGNYRDKEFSFVVEAASPWDHDMHGSTLSFTDVAIRGGYNHCSGYTGSLLAALSLGGCTVDLFASFADHAFEFQATIPEINIADLVNDVLNSIKLPDEMSSLEIDNLVVCAQPVKRYFSFEAQSSASVNLFSGFSFIVEQVQVARDAMAGAVTASMQMSWLLDPHTQPIDLSATYDSATGWAFQASNDNQYSLGALVDGLESLLGIDYPLPRHGLGIASIQAALVLAKQAPPELGESAAQPTRQFVVSCNIVDLSSSQSYGSLTLIAVRVIGKWDHIVVTELAQTVDTSQLPIVGHDLGKIVQISDATLLMASRAFTSEEVNGLIMLLPNGVPSLTPALVSQLRQGAMLTATLMVGDAVTPVQLPLGSSSEVIDGIHIGVSTTPSEGRAVSVFSNGANNALSGPIGGAKASQTSVQSTKWFEVHRAFGPLTIDRLGFRYDDGILYLLFDAEVAVGPMQMTLEGLGLGSSLGQFKLTPNLDGLGVALSAGPLDFSGAFMRGKSSAGTSYEGVLQVAAGDLSLALLGRYSDNSPPSFFVFGLLDEPPLGGPPYFFIEGLAFGFGYNNALVPPQLEDVAQFPIIQAVLPGMAPFGSNPTPDSVLTSLQSTGAIVDTRGEVWLAAGVRFSSFEMVESFALITAEVGAKLEFSLIGMSQASIPPDTDADPIAFAQLAIEASCDPDNGVLQVAGELTQASFVLSRACHLMGGFAFSTWFKTIDTPNGRVDAGDFVYTLGGYHPAYKVPAHYPQVPRLGLFWQVDDNLTVQGESYFAVTPYCVMAGCSVSAVWTSDGLRAWFDLDADFLMSWKPFFYSAEVGFSIGVSYRLNLFVTTVTISVEVDVSVSLQGPDFGGYATIDLSLFSITITFGASRKKEVIQWDQFCQSFLPAPLSNTLSSDVSVQRGVFKASPQAGLYRDLTKTASTGGVRWVFKGEKLIISLASPVPFTSLDTSPEKTNLQIDDSTWPQGIGINPMQVSANQFSAEASIFLERMQEGKWTSYSSVSAVALERSVPASLWSPVGSTQPASPNAETPLISAITEFTISRIKYEPDHTRDIPIENLLFENHSSPVKIVWPLVSALTSDSFETQSGNDQLSFNIDGTRVHCDNYVLSDVARPASARLSLIEAMKLAGMVVNENVDVEVFATLTTLDNWPQVRKLGEMRQ